MTLQAWIQRSPLLMFAGSFGPSLAAIVVVATAGEPHLHVHAERPGLAGAA